MIAEDDKPFEGYREFHLRCETLTGDTWCPYPSERFAQAVMIADDETARRLINKRRGYLFPSFVGCEPMETDILEIIGY